MLFVATEKHEHTVRNQMSLKFFSSVFIQQEILLHILHPSEFEFAHGLGIVIR